MSTREPEVETLVPLVHLSQDSAQMFLVTSQSDFGTRSLEVIGRSNTGFVAATLLPRVLAFVCYA